MRKRGVCDLKDLVITILLWVYYIVGWLCFYCPLYLRAYVREADRETAFQALNHRFHSAFFRYLGRLCPKVTWRIDPKVRAIQGAIIIANHRSFLDPIWLVSLFARQKTIVKRTYFTIPIFGWILKASGYVPSLSQGLFTVDMADQIKRLRPYLDAGGNLFIFPEGTRSRIAGIGPFDPGAFKIARLCRAEALEVVVIDHSDRLFPPGRFLFNTQEAIEVTLTSAGRLWLDGDNATLSVDDLMQAARVLMEPRHDP